MPVFGLQPQAIATPGGFAQGFSNLGAAFLNAPMEERKMALQQQAMQFDRAFKERELAQAFQIAQGHDQAQRDIWGGRNETSRYNAGLRTDTARDIAAGNNASRENVAQIGADSREEVANTRASASRYGADQRLKAAHERMIAEKGYDPHEEIDKAADKMIQSMPKMGPGQIPGIPEPLSMGGFMNQVHQIETWRAQQHAQVDREVNNAGDPQPDKPAPKQGPGQVNMGSSVQPAPGKQLATAPGATAQTPTSAAGAFGAGGGVGAGSAPGTNGAVQSSVAPKPGGTKVLPRSALRARVARGDFPDEATAEKDAKAHGFTITE